MNCTEEVKEKAEVNKHWEGEVVSEQKEEEKRVFMACKNREVYTE